MRIRFVGELMTCSMCGAMEQSDPRVESAWRCIELDGVGYYVCPKHFPPDKTATAKSYQHAYLKVLHHLIAVHRQRYTGLRH